MQGAVCLQDKWLEAVPPAGSLRQTIDDRGKSWKVSLNHTAVCSETPAAD